MDTDGRLWRRRPDGHAPQRPKGREEEDCRLRREPHPPAPSPRAERGRNGTASPLADDREGATRFCASEACQSGALQRRVNLRAAVHRGARMAGASASAKATADGSAPAQQTDHGGRRRAPADAFGGHSYARPTATLSCRSRRCRTCRGESVTRPPEAEKPWATQRVAPTPYPFMPLRAMPRVK
jgi:hypothetical protein